jgi:predicted nucleic acid-binding protein
MFVLDASVALAWAFEDEYVANSQDVLRRLRGESAVVPAVWPLEITNGLLVAQRRDCISMPDVLKFLGTLQQLAIRVDRAAELSSLNVLLSTAQGHLLSVYDASYLELAYRAQLPLATMDERLRCAAQAAEVQLID